MRIITPPAARRRSAVRTYQWVRIGLALAVAVFVVANIIVSLIYHGRTYPNTRLADRTVGSLSQQAFEDTVSRTYKLPERVTLSAGKDSTDLVTAGLPVHSDSRTTGRQVMERRSWLPLANFVTRHDIPVALTADYPSLQTTLSKSLVSFQHDPADAKLERTGDSFVIKPDTSGVSIDTVLTSQRLVSTLAAGKTQLTVATKPVAATVTAASLQKQLDGLQAAAKTSVVLRYGDKNKKFSSTDIISWYKQTGNSLTLSDDAVRSAVASAGAVMGVSVTDLPIAVTAVRQAVQAHKDLSYQLTTLPGAKTVTYCTAVRGVSDSELPALASKLQETYDDARSWSLGGLIRFQKADANCDLTVWLTAADQMASFGAICDEIWSCTVHPYVIINYDRWRYTSEAWQKSGGSLQDYRAMVINHETGHWFGFNHTSCPGPGQPAPVMQQQSIDLQGCVFNPWPTSGEQTALRQQLGL